MQSQKSHSFKLFLWKNIFVLGAVFCVTLLSMSFDSSEASALFVPTLSASVDQANLQVNGNSVINSTDKTTEVPLNLIVNTNNKTGYTATLNSETDEIALVNAGSISGTKIDSIDTDKILTNFLQNTWGYKLGNVINYSPIPALSTPSQILKTTEKTNGNETNSLKLGMKLGETLESGSYKNKLIFSILTNNYERIAVMTDGLSFNTKLKSLETAMTKIKHFKKSPTPPTITVNVKNIEDENSDYEIKLWLDTTDKTAYYYTEPEKVYLNKDSSRMFYRMFDLTSLNLSNFDTSRVTDMSGMFYNVYSLTSLDISNFDTSKVTNMRNMFSDLFYLTSLNLSNFDTSKVTDMSGMFSSTSLTSLNLSNFDTSQVVDMNNMFYGLSNLTSLNLSSFDTSKVTNMSGMFSSMHNLTSLNLSSFDTSKVTNMSGMFYGEYSLTSLDISNFDTSKVTDMSSMFSLGDEDADKDKLEKIYANNDFNTSSLTKFANIFRNRRKLRGGNGSHYLEPALLTNKTWLRVDRPGAQGYFTRKS